MAEPLTRRLDWVPKKDPQSRAYSLAPLVENVRPFTRLWNLDRHLDQGQEGACVGFGLSHMLAAEPVPCDVDNQFARRLYWEAQKLDRTRGGAYPGARPFYEGCDLLSGCKAVQKAGGCKSYKWSFSVDTTIRTICTLGPVVHGVMMTTGMMRPDSKGFIHPTGRVEGGHCIADIGVNMEREFFTWPQSWGTSHGVGGNVFVSFKDMEIIMGMEAETAIFLDPSPITIANLPPEVARSFWARFFGRR